MPSGPVDRRAVIDTIVQSSTVELFHSYGAAVAPLPRMPGALVNPRDFDHYGTIGYNARGFSGVLTLALPNAVLGLMPEEKGLNRREADWVRELTNQLMGRVKNRLMQFHVILQVGIPSVLGREALSRRHPRADTHFLYSFRTIRGSLVVTLEGSIDEAVIVYSGALRVASEGDIILF